MKKKLDSQKQGHSETSSGQHINHVDIPTNELYPLLEEHLTTLCKNINYVEGEDFEHLIYGIKELGRLYFESIKVEIEMLELVEGPLVKFKVPAHKLKWGRRYIKRVEDQMMLTIENDGDEYVVQSIKEVIKCLGVPFIELLRMLTTKEYGTYFDKFLKTRQDIKRKKFNETIQNMLRETRILQQLKSFNTTEE